MGNQEEKRICINCLHYEASFFKISCVVLVRYVSNYLSNSCFDIFNQKFNQTFAIKEVKPS